MGEHSQNKGSVNVIREGALATIVLARPRFHNALTWEMYEQLGTLLEQIATDDSVHVVVLRGAGGQAFAAGTDITQFEEFDAEAGVLYEQKIGHIIESLLKLPKPTIAAVEGYAVGGGLALAAACDLRYANESAQFGVPVARTLGNCLALRTSQRLIALLGQSRFLELVYVARLIGSREAYQAGLVQQVFTNAEFEERLSAVLTMILGNAPLTLWAAKMAVLRLTSPSQDGAFDDVVRRVYGSEDFREGVSAYRLKKKPNWTGR